jgi:hypothetical protein
MFICFLSKVIAYLYLPTLKYLGVKSRLTANFIMDLGALLDLLRGESAVADLQCWPEILLQHGVQFFWVLSRKELVLGFLFFNFPSIFNRWRCVLWRRVNFGVQSWWSLGPLTMSYCKYKYLHIVFLNFSLLKFITLSSFTSNGDQAFRLTPVSTALQRPFSSKYFQKSLPGTKDVPDLVAALRNTHGH